MAEPDDQPWEAPDGTRWLWFPQFGEWHGWMPGEDGLWVRTAEEFHDWYPEAPPWDAPRPASAPGETAEENDG